MKTKSWGLQNLLQMSEKLFERLSFVTREKTRNEAALDLLVLLNEQKDQYIITLNGFDFQREYSEIVISIRQLAKRWLWNYTKVFDFLEMLEKEKYITQTFTNNKGSVYRINVSFSKDQH
jgi:predicted transcriptional regulator